MSRALAKSCVAATAARCGVDADNQALRQPSGEVDGDGSRTDADIQRGRQASAVAADMPRNSLQFANGVIEGPSGVHVSRPRVGWCGTRKVSVLCETVPPVGLPRRN